MSAHGLRIGVGQLRNPSDEKLRYIRQLGVEDVIFNMAGEEPTPDLPLTGQEEWSVKELVSLRNRVEDAGLNLAAIENMPNSHYEDVMLGGPDAEEQLEHVKNNVRNLGRADIPVLGYHWMPNFVWRSSRTRRVRGGARATAYRHDDMKDAPNTHGREYSEEEMWENYERFVREVVPVAEEAGVEICVHPDDPPVEKLGGVPRLFRSQENYERALDVVDSDHHNVEFCIGSFTEMADRESVPDIVDRFADRVSYVHFRNISGRVPDFTERFIDEGDFDPAEVLGALADSEFEGVVIPDHVPEMDSDDSWASGRGYTVGFMQGVLAEMERGQ